MTENLMFYLVFLGQILLVSHYIPRRVLGRMKYVLKTYPPSNYPKLYPVPIEHLEEAQRKYKIMNLGTLMAGLLLLAVLLVASRSGEWNGAILTTYFMVQFLPLLLLELSSHKYFKLMRRASSHRKAELHPRRLFDFVSPAAVSVAIFMYIAFILLILYVRLFEFPWFTAAGNIIGVTVLYLFFTVMVVRTLYGKKLDPYQTHADRLRQIELTVRIAVYSSIVSTLFIAIAVVLASLDLRHLQSTVQSVFFQLLAVISFQALRIDDTNFDVYREEPLAP